MKRLAPLVAFALCLTLLNLPLLAANAAKADAKTVKTPGLELAALATQVTGIAISPMLGVSAVGAYKWFQAGSPEQRAALPWFASPSFWLLGLALVGVVALK